MKLKFLFALLLCAATHQLSARYSLVTGTNHVTTISFTNTFFEGVCTVEGRDGNHWVPLQNFFTTQRVGQVKFTLPTNYSRFRLVGLAIGPGNTFTRLSMAYGSIHTIAGLGGPPPTNNAWIEGTNATGVYLSDPRYATADEAGNIYVLERGAHSVDQISPDGKIRTFVGIRKAGTGDFIPNRIATEFGMRSPSAIYYTHSNLYVLDAGNNRFVEVKKGRTNDFATSFSVPPDVGTNSGGLWVGLTPVVGEADLFEAFYGNGTELKHLKNGVVSVVRNDFLGISHVTIDPQGRTIVCDPLDNRVYRVRGSGSKEPVAGTGFLTSPRSNGKAKRVALPGASSVWHLPIGGYLVSLDSGARVWCVDADDQAAPLVFGAPGVNTGDGEWFRAHGRVPKISNVLSVCVAPNGDIIILEREGIIRKIDFLRHIP